MYINQTMATAAMSSSLNSYVPSVKRPISQSHRQKPAGTANRSERIPFRAYLQQKGSAPAALADLLAAQSTGIATSLSSSTVEFELTSPTFDDADDAVIDIENERISPASDHHRSLYIHSSLRKSPSAPLPFPSSPSPSTPLSRQQRRTLRKSIHSSFGRFSRRLRSPFLLNEDGNSRANTMDRRRPKRKSGKTLPKSATLRAWLMLAYQWILWLIETRLKPAKEAENAENDDSEDEDMARTRYRPESIEGLARKTRFSPTEIGFMYRGFKNDCPFGVVDRDTFKDIFCSFFPQGDASTYADLVFTSLDVDRVDELTFEQYLTALSNMARGTQREQINWIYALYDKERRGFTTRADFVNVARATYDMLGENIKPSAWPNTAIEQANKAFDRMDSNLDGLITKAEFVSACERSNHVMNSLPNMDTFIRTS